GRSLLGQLLRQPRNGSSRTSHASVAGCGASWQSSGRYAHHREADEAMKFGIFYEHQLPRPWEERSEYELFQNSLAQIELADRLGYDYAWEVEHRFLEEYSHSSAPEVFLGAASQRTRNIRLGHGIVQLTTNQPHRIAE